MISRTLIAATVAFATMMATEVQAHEYYLLPQTFTPAVGETVPVSHKLGQRFNGNEMPYVGIWNVRSEQWNPSGMEPVKGLDGDRPALQITVSEPGITVVVHQSNIDKLTFKSWEKFKTYAFKEGLGDAVAATLKSDKPKDTLKEGYSRYAKTLLVTSGDTSSLDRPTGLKIELVALANPNALDQNEPMPVQVLLDGKPLPGVMIKMFTGIDTEASHRILTDAEGKAPIPARGPGPYLLNAIHMSEPQSEGLVEDGVHWESFWASLTFARPN
ncbi:DUF4198 domain-containing protein [Ahrensia sp. R2A130]|uniref:DUF4198 domain-containing protein n=1 Tax=Ahrensia sp. R2A130 TaxID=744979 RepID=UPI0001E0B536|nr:DUF4198 domain-containing protein [Ahrensia sp. R2A130]EFL87802.1 conserved hypothetical protein [Ahrensia sp. R2A130]